MSRRINNRGSRHPQSQQFAEEFNEISQLTYKWKRYIYAVALNRIKWGNLPETVDERFLETTLITEGRALLYDSLEGDGQLILGTRVVTRGPMDLYDNYTEFTSIGNNGHHQDVSSEHGFICYDSRTRTHNGSIIKGFIEELVDLDRLRKINRKQQRWAKIITVDEAAQADMVSLQRSLDFGDPYLLAIKGFNVSANTLDLSTPYIQEELENDKLHTLNSLYSFLGVKNQPFEKSQYQHEEEVMIANDHLAKIREDLLAPRREVAELANEKWGLNITVDWNNDQFEILELGPSVATENTDRDIVEDKGGSE